MEAINLKILLILTVGLAYASLFGYLAYKLKLSPIIGYLLAGFLIGPFSPGFIADLQLAEQLAEIGVVLMMFGVGLHFNWQDLVSTSHISVPGAIIQTLITTVLCTLIMHYQGWSIDAGIIMGMAIGVTSTVVLARILQDNHLLRSKEGHIAMGWLIVEDLLTIAALLVLPVLAETTSQEEGVRAFHAALSFSFAVFKFLILALVMLTLGKKIISFLLRKVYETNSNELFTLAIVAMTFLIATGSAVLLGTSIALGALLAGLVISQTNLKEKIATTSDPIKDIFVVVFFLSIGMLFNPYGILDHPELFLALLGIILIVKPLAGYFLTLGFKYPQKTAIIIGLALAQIGEFSFILSEGAMRYNIITDEAYDILVACSLISIALNPILFKVWKHKTV